MTNRAEEEYRRDEEYVHGIVSQYVSRFPWADRLTMELTLALNSCSRSYRIAQERAMEGVGVGRIIGRSTILRALYFADRRLSHKELGQQLRVRPATVTSMVNGLEKEGLVSRTPGESDRRTSYVALTDEGRAMSERLLPTMPNLSADLWQSFSGEERELLLSLLLRFLRSSLAYNHRGAIPPTGPRP